MKYRIQPILSTLLAFGMGVMALNAGDIENRKQNFYRADSLIGYDVYDAEGLKVGDISDMVFSTSNGGQVQYVVVMTGGFANLTGEERAVPASEIHFDGNHYRISVAKQEYLKTPVLRGDLADDIAGTEYQNQLTAIYVEQPKHALHSPEQLLSWDELRNRDVEMNEELVGFLEDALVNLSTGELSHYLFRPSRGSMLYSSIDRRYAVPTADVVHENWADVELTLTRDKLEEATHLSEAGWISREQSDRGVVFEMEA